MVGLELDGSSGVSIVLGDYQLIRLVRTGNETKVLLHIAIGAELALYFAGPEADANGAPGLHLESGQDTHDFHGDYAARAIVGCARGRGPGIEVSAEHNDFVFQLGVRAGNFGDGIKAVFVISGESCVNVEFNAYGDAGFQETIDAAVVFNRGDRDGQGIRMFALID